MPHFLGSATGVIETILSLCNAPFTGGQAPVKIAVKLAVFLSVARTAAIAVVRDPVDMGQLIKSMVKSSNMAVKLAAEKLGAGSARGRGWG